jgi:hypothetical protein
MRVAVALLLLVCSASSIAQGIFLHSRSAASNRIAILEDDERVAYLYLTKPGTQQPEKDAIVYMRVQPIDRVDWEAIKKTGATPLLTKELASSSAVVAKPVEREFSFRWSRDGNAVAVLRGGAPLAFASMSERFGYSKAVSKSSPLANAWDQAKYESLFKE